MSDQLDFPHGSMLTVLRAVGGFDVHGDPIGDGDGWEEVGEIGPCSILKTSSGRDTNRQERNTNRISVTHPAAQADQVLSVDRVRLPSGYVAKVSNDPKVAKNSFTGWAPYSRFTLEEVT